MPFLNITLSSESELVGRVMTAELVANNPLDYEGKVREYRTKGT